jgi:hypothetical protein
LSILFSLNLLLAAFNMLPVPPLDGITAIGLVLSENARKVALLGTKSLIHDCGNPHRLEGFRLRFQPAVSLRPQAALPGRNLWLNWSRLNSGEWRPSAFSARMAAESRYNRTIIIGRVGRAGRAGEPQNYPGEFNLWRSAW